MATLTQRSTSSSTDIWRRKPSLSSLSNRSSSAGFITTSTPCCSTFPASNLSRDSSSEVAIWTSTRKWGRRSPSRPGPPAQKVRPLLSTLHSIALKARIPRSISSSRSTEVGILTKCRRLRSSTCKWRTYALCSRSQPDMANP